MSCEKVLNENVFGGTLLYKSYGKKEVLRYAELNVAKNGIVGIFGLNGSGKTTLLRILSGLDGAFQGTLYKTDFEDVAYMSVDSLHSPEMRVKDLINFYDTFLENQRTEKIYVELQAARINPNAFLLSLSTGMRQYVKFLLTVYSGASVCLFDEPLSNLDVNLRERVKKTLIMEINEEKLFIVTTHEIKEFEQLIDGFFILKNGKLSTYYDCEEVVEMTGKSVGEFYKEKVNEKNY
ncbi:MAG: ATP-binding cassette domain-containing protein [Clostridia bacterium]|nr:ATP-binding cassette domain-containing protein [Clostridia bacterium]